MYRVRGPDGKWVKKSESRKIVWVEHEHQATFWKKLHHLKNALSQGIFSREHDPLGYLEGLPLESLKVVEYRVSLERTRRTRRLTEMEKFHVPRDGPKQVPDDPCDHTCSHGYDAISHGAGPAHCQECNTEV